LPGIPIFIRRPRSPGAIAALVSFFALAVGASPARSAVTIQAGKPFPNLVLPALEDGSPRSLLDYRGRKVVLHVFASW